MPIGSIYIIVVSLVGLIWLWYEALRKPRVKQPCCEQCGYPVEGLESLQCPECGGDFRTLGIATPIQRLLSPWLFIPVWTLLLPIPGTLITQIARDLGPRNFNAATTINLGPRSGLFPDLRMVQTMRQSQMGDGQGVSGLSVGGSPDEENVTLLAPPVLQRAPDEVIFEISAPNVPKGSGSHAPHIMHIRGGRDATIDEQALEAWVLSLEENIELEGIREDMAELKGVLNGLAQQQPQLALRRLNVVGGVSTSTNVTNVPWFVTVLAIFWIAVYGAGVLVFMQVRKRRLTA
jgi:hypothetical protein